MVNKMKKLKKFLVGGFVALSLVAFSVNSFGGGITQDMPGAYNFGPGIKHGGWSVSEAAETTTENSITGTITTFALPGSSTVYLVADLVGQAGTGTMRTSLKITGTFDRDGTDAMTKVGTATLDSDFSENEAQTFARWEADDSSTNEVQLVVHGTNTKVQWITTVRSMVVTTAGDE